MVTCMFWGCKAPSPKPLSRECLIPDFERFESEARKWRDDSTLILGDPNGASTHDVWSVLVYVWSVLVCVWPVLVYVW